MMKRLLLGLLVALALGGCASSVKLDEAPVEDKSGTSVQAGTPPAGGTTAGAQSGVATVKADDASGSGAGPAGTARLVYFDFDSYVVKPEFVGVIEGHARYLKAAPARRIVIQGHTDERGGREYNLALGQRRSEAVRRALTLLGVADAQIEAVSFGKEKPAVPGSDEAAWAQNRRAEISYRP